VPEANVVEFIVSAPNVNQLWIVAHESANNLIAGNRYGKFTSGELTLHRIEQGESIVTTNFESGPTSRIISWDGTFRLTVHGLFEAP
jgi:hypothetical protein